MAILVKIIVAQKAINRQIWSQPARHLTTLYYLLWFTKFRFLFPVGRKTLFEIRMNWRSAVSRRGHVKSVSASAASSTILLTRLDPSTNPAGSTLHQCHLSDIGGCFLLGFPRIFRLGLTYPYPAM